MSKLFDWFKSENKAPQLGDMIAVAEAKVADLKTAVAAVVADAADQMPGAVERYRVAKAELAAVQSDLDMLLAMKAEHEERAARQQAERRRAAHAERVAAVKADLEASHQHAEALQRHLAEAVKAYDALLVTRRKAMDHSIKLPDYSEVQIGQTRGAVAQEVYRQGARLNNVSVNQMGFPAPSCEDGRLASRPDIIEPLTDRLARVDANTVAQLEGAAP